jgi:predicted phosphodiesterase
MKLLNENKRLVRWLHLSDWHQKGADFDRTVVRDALIDDLRDRCTIDPDFGEIDFVIFSGDAAYHGVKIEFNAARKFFFEPILETLGLEPNRLIIVPGNHDLQRSVVEDLSPGKLQKPLLNTDEVNYWLTDSKRLNRAMEPLEEFSHFVETYTGETNAAYASRTSLQLEAATIHVLGLNTSWMCGRKTNGEQYNDDRFLVLGEPQIHEGLKWLKEGDIRIVVQHHPFEWLARFDRDQVERRIKTETDFVLWGHEHSPKVEITHGTAGSCVTIPAGAAYDRRRGTDSRYVNAYNLVRLDLDAGIGTVFLRRWSEAASKWIPDTDSEATGKYSIPLPERITQGGQEASTLRNLSAVSDAGAVYRQLLLKSCDIIDLANLPGQDRLLVQRQLDLRRLFVPLHVSIEKPPTNTKAWNELETRREARKRLSKIEEGSHERRAKVGHRLAAARRLIILGDPGGGKTTLTRWIATSYLLRLKKDPDQNALPEVETLPSEDWLPVLIRCRDLDREGSTDTLNSMLEQSLRKSEMREDLIAPVKTYLKAEIDGGRALLIVDGLDEVADAARRMLLCEQLERIADAHPDLPIIATSRIVGYRQMGRRLGKSFEHLILCELQLDEKEQFARRWCNLTMPIGAEEAAEQLISDIRSNDRVQQLTGNPMLLTTMALVKRSIGRLPQRRAELYVEAVKALVNWRNDQGERLDPEEASPQLQYIAYKMCDLGIQSLRRDQLLAIIAEMRDAYPNIHYASKHTPAEFVELLESRTGIMHESGHVRHRGEEVALYEFRHLTFQEFLAAQALVKRIHPGYRKGEALADRVAPLVEKLLITDALPRESDSWREVLRLCLNLCDPSDVDSVMEVILYGASEATSTFPRASFATTCLTDEPNASDFVARQVFSELLNLMDAPFSDLTDSDTLIDMPKSRWKDLWQESIVKKLKNTHPSMQVEIASYIEPVVGYMKRDGGSPEIEFGELQQSLKSMDIGQNIVACIKLVNLAYNKILTEGEISQHGYLPMLDSLLIKDPVTSLMAVWALSWIAANYRNEIPHQNVLWQFEREDTNEKLADFTCWFFSVRPHPDAIPALERLADEPKSIAFDRAISGLVATGTATSSGILQAKLRHPKAKVRAVTFSALVTSLAQALNPSIAIGWMHPRDPRKPIGSNDIDLISTDLGISSEEANITLRDFEERYEIQLKRKY